MTEKANRRQRFPCKRKARREQRQNLDCRRKVNREAQRGFLRMKKAGSSDSWIPELMKWGGGILLAGIFLVAIYFMVDTGTDRMTTTGENAFDSVSNSSSLSGGRNGTVTNGVINGGN